MVSSAKVEWFPFSESEKTLLRESWQLLKTKKNAIGCNIYEMIFLQCPEIRRLFPKMKSKGGKIDKKATEFSFQALRFVQTIESGIFSLDNLREIDNILDNLGRRHGKLELSGKFRAYYWSTFLECSICMIRKELCLLRNYNDEKVDQLAGYNADIAHRLNQMSIDDNASNGSNGRRSSVQSSATAASTHKSPFALPHLPFPFPTHLPQPHHILKHGPFDKAWNPLHILCKPCQITAVMVKFVSANPLVTHVGLQACNFIVPAMGPALLHLYLSYTPPDVVCARILLCYGNGIFTSDHNTGRAALANTTHLIPKLPLSARDLTKLKILNEPTETLALSKALTGQVLGKLTENIPITVKDAFPIELNQVALEQLFSRFERAARSEYDTSDTHS